MHKKIIAANEGGQRLDKFLHKYLPEAESAFIHKMLRKKNITLNGKKAVGGEKIALGDELTFYLADETIQKFRGEKTDTEAYVEAYLRLPPSAVLFENDDVLIVNKAAGVLCQKAQPDDISLNEWLLGYLLAHEDVSAESLMTFKPSVLNRLDRNTGGIVLCGKSLAASQELSRLLQERKIRRFYRLLVHGQLSNSGRMEAYLDKDVKKNKVSLSAQPTAGASPVLTHYESIALYRGLVAGSHISLVEAEIVSGKSHQIRAQFAAAGHPVIGDYKYGLRAVNDEYKRRFGIDTPLLHAVRMVFPRMEGPRGDLSGMEVVSPLPDVFARVSNGRSC